jgi:hypothetical protein
MFGSDPDFQKIVPIAPAIVFEMREDYKAKFDVIIKELKHFQLKKSKERTEEILLIEQCTSKVKQVSDSECIAKLEKYQHQKKILIKKITASRNTAEVDQAVKTLKDCTTELSNFLMSAEMIIVEQLEEVFKEFERNYIELCSSCNEFGQSSFARLRELENDHQEKFSETINALCDRFSKGDLDDVDDDVRDVNYRKIDHER